MLIYSYEHSKNLSHSAAYVVHIGVAVLGENFWKSDDEHAKRKNTSQLRYSRSDIRGDTFFYSW